MRRRRLSHVSAEISVGGNVFFGCGKGSGFLKEWEIVFSCTGNGFCLMSEVLVMEVYDAVDRSLIIPPAEIVGGGGGKCVSMRSGGYEIEGLW